MEAIKVFVSRILSILFPDYCIGCSTINALICNPCLSRVPRAQSSEHSFIHPVFDYRTPLIKEAIWRLKYKNARRIAREFSQPLYDELIAVYSDTLITTEQEKILLVDIPLHKNRLRERGYNQSELLIQAILSHDTSHIFEYIPHILTRARATKPQARFEKRSVRLSNLKDAFVCKNPNLVHGRTIVLIDDVTTTGATLDEARRTLARAKPRSIIAITLAH